MSEFKGTRGEVENYGGDNASIDIILVNNATISISRYDRYGSDLVGTREEMEDNANLIVDAFKVRQQINCELSELKEQRDEMFEYLIKTYTNENDLVLDNAAGSGTTGIACMNTNRNCILIEKEQKYFDIINERIKNHINQQKLF